MVSVVRAEAVITAQNRLRPGLAAATRDLESFRRTQAKAAAAFGRADGQMRAMQRMEAVAGTMRSAAMGLGGALLAGGGLRALQQAAVRFAEVDRAMARTGITGDATAQQTREGMVALRDMARDTATLFDPAQKGLDAITASGRSFTEALKMMPSVLKTAQASGAGVSDIADSSTALMDHMAIAVEGLAEAQDTLAMGGKLGKFELKDMARYLPTMLPAFKALGQSGQEGLRNLVAMLQVIRSGTGTAEEAAASAYNIFQKMESEETAKKFEKMGIDLRKEMAKARKEGKNLLDVFVELSNKALKGDLSKVPQLFSDSEVARGMRPLLAGLDKIAEYRRQLVGSKGTIDTDFARIIGDSQANLDKFRESADRAKTAVGSLAAEVASPLIATGAKNLDGLAQVMERAAEAGREGGPMAAASKVLSDFTGSVSDSLDEWEKTKARLQAEADGQRANAPVDKAVSDNTERANLNARDPAGLTRHEVARRHVLNKRGEQSPVAATDRGGWLDWLTGDTSLAATREALAKLDAKEKAGGSLSYFDRVNQKTFRNRLSAAERAWSADQFRRAGLGDLPGLNTSGPDFDAAREALREARRAGAFRGMSGGEGGPAVPSGAAKRGGVLPPVRPRDLGGGTAMVPFGELEAKADAVKSSVEAIGPAGQMAGSAMASGYAAGLSQMETATDAAIARIQQKLNSLRAPSLSFGGVSGLNTGRDMQEVR